MADTRRPTRGFVQSVRSALAHLYDEPYLQNHALAFRLDAGQELDQATRAQRLRGTLLDCVEQLRPRRQADVTSSSARAYVILSYRYLDDLSMQEIAGRLSLSARQVYREHDKGVRAIAGLLCDRLGGEGRSKRPRVAGAGETAANRHNVAQAEVDRLRQAAHAETLDLLEVVASAIQRVALVTQPKGIQVKLVSAVARPLTIADRVMLRQALMNLLSYAATGMAGAELTVAVSAEECGQRVEISGDIGGGEPGLTSPGPPPANTVNLTVAQALIEAQGGHLDTDLRDRVWRARVLLAAPAKASLLVIDDNADLIALIQRYLGGYGVSVVGATDGLQALRLAAELQPQVIILDVMMPSQDGWEILQQLKQSPGTGQTPIVVCSVLNEPQLALAMGASDYITKPISQADLLQVLRPWLVALQPSG